MRTDGVEGNTDMVAPPWEYGGFHFAVDENTPHDFVGVFRLDLERMARRSHMREMNMSAEQ